MDVSVVVVHGMGTQPRGATVTTWVENVLRFTDVQRRRGAPTAVTGFPAGREPAAGPRRPGQPASALLEIGAPGSWTDPVLTDPVVRLRVVEAHWAEDFPAPRPLDVLRWLLWFAPSFALTQMVLEARAAAPAAGARQLRPFAPIYSIALGLVLLALVGPVLLTGVVVLVVSTVVPSRRVQEGAVSVLALLSQNVGDVQSFLIRPVARARMEARVRAVVTAEVRRWGREGVHVLATSQGAALGHAALLGLRPELRPARLTTVGGAHGRLNDMRLLPPPRWTRVPIVLTGLAWFVALPVLGAVGPGPTAALITAVTLGSVLALAAAAVRSVTGLAQERTERGEPALPSPGVIPGVDWLDLWAPFDLVPNGRPVADPAAGVYRFVLVPGEMEVLGDHISYGEDWAESIPRILHHLTSALPPPARLGAPRGVRARRQLGDPGGTGSNWTPWARRDWASLALRVTPVLAAVGALLSPGGRDRYRAVGTTLAEAVPLLARGVTAADRAVDAALGLFGPAVVSAAGTFVLLLGTVVALGLAVGVAAVTAALFRAATLAEATTWARSLPGGAPRRWSTRRWALVAGGIGLVWAALVGLAIAVVSAMSG